MKCIICEESNATIESKYCKPCLVVEIHADHEIKE